MNITIGCISKSICDHPQTARKVSINLLIKMSINLLKTKESKTFLTNNCHLSLFPPISMKKPLACFCFH